VACRLSVASGGLLCPITVGTGGFALSSLGSCCSHLECGRIRVVRDVVISRSPSASN
jgi:hypothetical protein